MNELLKQLLIILASYFFTKIAKKYKNFPLDEKTFVNLILWIFALVGIVNGLLAAIKTTIASL